VSYSVWCVVRGYASCELIHLTALQMNKVYENTYCMILRNIIRVAQIDHTTAASHVCAPRHQHRVRKSQLLQGNLNVKAAAQHHDIGGVPENVVDVPSLIFEMICACFPPASSKIFLH